MVIDYPAEEPKQVSDLLHALADRAAELAHPVRVLLLERDARGEWIKALALDRTGAGPLVAARATDLALAPIGWDDLPRVQQAVHQARDLPTPNDNQTQSFMDHLSAIASGPDGGVTMLSALLLADAIARGEAFGAPGSTPTSVQIHQSALNHELRIWDQHGIGADQRAVLALATLTLGLSRQEHDTMIAERLKVVMPSVSQCRIVAGPDCSEDSLPPVRPDPLGEAYVAHWLAMDGARDPSRREGVAALAWAHNPHATATFLLRCGADLRADQHQQLEHWLGSEANTPNTTPGIKLHWMLYSINNNIQSLKRNINHDINDLKNHAEVLAQVERNCIASLLLLTHNELARPEAVADLDFGEVQLQIDRAKPAVSRLMGPFKGQDSDAVLDQVMRLNVLYRRRPEPMIAARLASGFLARGLLVVSETGDTDLLDAAIRRAQILRDAHPGAPELDETRDLIRSRLSLLDP